MANRSTQGDDARWAQDDVARVTQTGDQLTLLTPTDDSVVDITDGETFTWDYAGVQTAFEFKRRRGSGSPWQWWNGSGWQSTPTSVASAVEAVTFTAGQW